MAEGRLLAYPLMQAMRRRFAFFFLLSSTSALVPLAACGDTAGEPARLDIRPEPEGGRSRTDSAVEPSPDGSQPPPPEPGAGRVYAHTTDSLFLYEPIAGQLTEIGKFSCLKGAEDVIDLAVDRTGNMYATTFRRFLSVDPITATCTEVALAPASDDYPNALSFVPAGTVDPTKEVLVGYASLSTGVDSINYVRIDVDGPTPGKMTKIGNLNASDAGAQYKSSGDLVSLIQDGNRTYLTIRNKSDLGSDFLAEVDPKNGNIKRIIGDTKQENLFGFGYWAGKGYGFAENGRVVEIDMDNGSSTVLKTLSGDGGAPIPWYGAGVTTQAPVR